MTYDWQQTLEAQPGSRQWFEEIDKRFLESAYYANDRDGNPFGKFLISRDVQGKDVLEIGCGMGTHAGLLAKAGARLTAVDLTSRAVETTSRRFETFGLAGKIQIADAEHLQFPDQSFDMVWSWGVIHHSSSMETCLSEIYRVLRPGGRLLLMVYNRQSIVYYFINGFIRGILMGKLLHQSLQQIYTESSDGFYARVLSKNEMEGMLGRGYSNIETDTVGLKAELVPIPRFFLKEALERMIPDRIASLVLGRWGSMLVVRARKD